MKNLENAYRQAKDAPADTRPARLAALADTIAADAFDRRDYGPFNRPCDDDMMAIEAQIFGALCRANRVDWRNL